MRHLAKRAGGARVAGALVVLVAASALLGACAARLDTAPRGYTCCNLRTTGGWITSENVQGDGDVMPPGLPAELVYIKRGMYVYGVFGDDSVSLRNDGAETELQTQHWIRHLVTRTDPRPALASWPADVQAAVRAARVRTGMTREQVLMAIAYPWWKLTPDLAATTWLYRVAGFGPPIQLVFDGQHLARIDGPAAAVARVEFAH